MRQPEQPISVALGLPAGVAYSVRIIAGDLGGRRIKTPAGASTRPTSDRVREALFSILGSPGSDTRVLDLFAGAGTLGLEAISRGAESVTFVDSSRSAVRVLRDNIGSLGVQAQCTVTCADSIRTLDRLMRGGERFDWVFLDPPYKGDLAARALAILGTGSIFRDAGVVILEHDKRNTPLAAYGSLVRTDSRRYGDTEISFFEKEKS